MLKISLGGGICMAGFLAAAQTVDVRVDVGQTGGRALDAGLFGVALAQADGRPAAEQAEILRLLNAPSFITYSFGFLARAVKPGQAPDYTELDKHIAKLKTLPVKTVFAPLSVPPLLGTDRKDAWFSIDDPDHRRLWVDTVAGAARRVKEAGVRVGYWEVPWNEPEGAMWSRKSVTKNADGTFRVNEESANQGRKPEALEPLWTLSNELADALKAADPECRVGGPAISWPYGNVLRPFLKTCGAKIDFLSYHEYGTGSTNVATQAIFTNLAARYAIEAEGIRRMLAAEPSTAGRAVELILSEYNINYGWAPGEKRQQTQEGAVFTALALLGAHAAGLDKAAIWSAEGNSAFGLIPRLAQPSLTPAGMVLNRLKDAAPGRAVSVAYPTNNTPLRVFATVRDARVCVVLVNPSETETVTARMNIGNTSVTVKPLSVEVVERIQEQ
jgi:hypothetical protein